MNKENIFKTTKSTMYMLFGMLLFALVSASCGKDAEVQSLNLFDENALLPEDEGIKPIEIFTITAVTEPSITDSVKKAGLPGEYGNNDIVWNKTEERGDVDANKDSNVTNYRELTNFEAFTNIGIAILDHERDTFRLTSNEMEDAEVSIKFHNTMKYLEYSFDIKGLINEGDLSGVKYFNRKQKRQENIQTSFKEFLEKYDVYVTAHTINHADQQLLCPNLKVKAKKEAEDSGKKYIFNSFKNNGSEWQAITTTDAENSFVILGQKHFKIAKAQDLHFVLRVDQKSDGKGSRNSDTSRDGSRFGIVIVDKNQKKVVFSKLICYKTSMVGNRVLKIIKS